MVEQVVVKEETPAGTETPVKVETPATPASNSMLDEMGIVSKGTGTTETDDNPVVPVEGTVGGREEQAAKMKAEAEAAEKAKGETTEETPEGETPDGDDDFDASQYVTSENPDIQAVLSILVEREVPRAKSDEIFAEAWKTGDISKIDVPELKRTVGESTADLMMRQITGAVETQKNAAKTEKARVQKEVEAVHKAAGGKDQWDKAAEWAKANYSAEEAKDLNAMFATGGTQAQLATQHILAGYKKSGSFVEAAEIVSGDGGNTAQIGAPLTDRNEYLKLLKAENNRPSGPRASVVNSLNARRERALK